MSARVDPATVPEPVESGRPDQAPEPAGRRTGWSLADTAIDDEIFLAIHKFVRFTPNEIQVLDHPAVQRLRRPYQLGQTNLVYPSATHRRFEHSIGSLFMAVLIIETLDRNSLGAGRHDAREKRWKLANALSPLEQVFTRLGALLHDVGHVPAGHTFEDELALLPPHDADARLGLVFDRGDWFRNYARSHGTYDELAEYLAHDPETGEKHDTLRERIDRLYDTQAHETGLDMSPTDVVLSLISKDRGEQPVSCEGFRTQVCRDIIGNTICADILDYLHRDWHHLGKHKELDLRLIDYMEVRYDEPAYRQDRRLDARLVVYLRGYERVRSDGVSAILDLLESRYHLFEIALYHKTKLCATAMLERVISELDDDFDKRLGAAELEKWRQALLMRLLDGTDEEVVDSLGEEAYGLYCESDAGDQRRDHLRGIVNTTVSLRQRRLHKKIYAGTEGGELDAKQADDVRSLYAPEAEDGGGVSGDDASVEARRNRLAAMRLLEKDFGLPPLSMAMYCATRRTSMKVANVNVLYNDQVRTLWEYETELRHGLTGGHLAAQEARYRGLWRVIVACEQSVFENRGLEWRDLVRAAIEWCVLGSEERLAGERGLLLRLTDAPESPFHGGTLLPEPRGLGGDGRPLAYPTGRYALRELIDTAQVPRPAPEFEAPLE